MFQCCAQTEASSEEVRISNPLPKPDPLLFFTTKSEISYSATRDNINKDRSRLNRLYTAAASEENKKQILDGAGIVFTEIIVHQLLPYWYGTKWTFEGHTDVPGEGEIACGYLVSTTLKHAGLNLNRYKLAQQAAAVGLRSIAFEEEIEIYRSLTPVGVEQKFIKDNTPGLYQVGLDYHVGYLYFTGTELYFLHSSFTGPAAAVAERVTDCPVFSSSAYYVLDITHNRGLMRAWLSSAEIPIVK